MSIEEGFSNALGSIGLRISEGWPDSVNTDMLVINGPLTLTDADMEGCDVMSLYELTVLISLGAGVSRAHRKLVPYLEKSGDKSIRAALYAKPTLNGAVQSLFWRGIGQPPSRITLNERTGVTGEIDGREAYGATCLVEVMP